MNRPPQANKLHRTVLDELRRRGLLLESSGEFPSVTTRVCGDPVQGSWWSHPQGSLIHHVLEALAAHADVNSIKLISGKVTLVHRVTVATTCRPWYLSCEVEVPQHRPIGESAVDARPQKPVQAL